ncbi:MAG: hypothetical protein KDE22_07540 [Rhodobacterales bacterium]|nr:hypothetical protein [Rhodobacterales bacterium]
MARPSKNPFNSTTLTIGGMTAALGTLVYTGMVRGRGWKPTHVGAGVALVALSLWHASQQAKYARLAGAKAAKGKTGQARAAAR